MDVGKITKIFYDKGYGSIRTRGGADVHFHKNCLWDIRFDELTEGQEVDLETQIAYNGLLGFNIRPHREEKFPTN